MVRQHKTPRHLGSLIFRLFGNVKHLRISIMSKTASLAWTNPTLKYTGVEVAMRVAGAPSFTVLAVVSPGVTSHAIPALDDGDYEFQVTALNGALRAPNPPVIAGSVVTPPPAPVEVAPDNVTGLTVTFA